MLGFCTSILGEVYLNQAIVFSASPVRTCPRRRFDRGLMVCACASSQSEKRSRGLSHDGPYDSGLPGSRFVAQ